MKEQFIKRGGIIFVALLAILFPLGFTDNLYVLHVMTSAFIFIIAIYGLNLLAGYTGQLSLAHAGFFAIGAYSFGILTTTYDVSYWVAFFLAILITTVIGGILGIFALRTKEHFFAIYTLIIGFLIYLVIGKWDEMTGGVRGLLGIPIPDPIGPIEFNTPISMYYFVLFFLFIAIFVARRIVYSLTGRTYISIRNSEELAQTIGINTSFNKLVSFIISVAFAALAGVLYAAFNRFLGPEIANLPMVFNFLMYLIIGGLGTLSGPIIGTLIIVWLTQFMQDLQEYRMLVFGPILTILVIFYPAGIAGLFISLKARIPIFRKKPKKDNQKNESKKTG